MDTFVQQIINGLVLGSMYALVALGYTMVYGIINLINFAHGEVMMVGALTSWTVVTALAGSGLPGWVILLISLACAIVVCTILNFTIEKIAYRPLRNAPRLAPLITAMGMSLLLQTLAMIIWKPNPKPYPSLLPSEPINLGGPFISVTQVLILGVTGVVMLALMIPSNYFLIKEYGIIGSAYAQIISMTVYNFIRWEFLRRKFNMQPFTWKTLYTLLWSLGSFLIIYYTMQSLTGWLGLFARAISFSALMIAGVFWLRLTPDALQLWEKWTKR